MWSLLKTLVAMCVMSLSVDQTLTRGWKWFPRRIQLCCSAIKVEPSLLASFVVEKLVSQWSINPYLSTGGVAALNSYIFQPKWCRGWRRNKGTSEGCVEGRGESSRAITRQFFGHSSLQWWTLRPRSFIAMSRLLYYSCMLVIYDCTWRKI